MTTALSSSVNCFVGRGKENVELIGGNQWTTYRPVPTPRRPHSRPATTHGGRSGDIQQFDQFRKPPHITAEGASSAVLRQLNLRRLARRRDRPVEPRKGERPECRPVRGRRSRRESLREKRPRPPATGNPLVSGFTTIAHDLCAVVFRGIPRNRAGDGPALSGLELDSLRVGTSP
jgi:hypothetical protein